MILIILKLTETLARALFVFVGIYSLSIEQAGQFGILVTLIGLFAFLFGFERHIDIQRKFAHQSDQLLDATFGNAVWLYLVNYVVLIPVFFVTALSWGQLPWLLALTSIVIVVSEHISNQTYQMALINNRYRKLIVITVAKNVINIVVVGAVVVFSPQGLLLTDILKVWAITSLLSAILIIVIWWCINQGRGVLSSQESLLKRIGEQYKMSLSHFVIGLFAIISLQLDRIMAGSLLDLKDTGVYFRHVMLIAFIYQFFNIASFNRILPAIFSHAQSESVQILRIRLRREYFRVVVFVIILYTIFLVAYFSPLQMLFAKYQVAIELLGILFVSFLLRALADFNGLVYNAKHKEKHLLKFQVIALLVGIFSFFLLTLLFGMVGTIVAGMVSAGTYLYLTTVNYKKIEYGDSK